MIFLQFLSVFLIVLIGYVFGLLRKPKPEQVDLFSKIVLWVFVPAIVMTSTAGIRADWTEYNEVVKISIYTFGILAVLGIIYTRLRKTSRDHKRLLMISILLMNCGYLGIPVCESLGGMELRKAAIYYTVIYMPAIAVSSEMIFSKNGAWGYIKTMYKDIYIISIALGFLLSFIPVDNSMYFLVTFIRRLGDIAPTLMLLLIGLYFAQFKDPLSKQSVEATVVRFAAGAVTVIILLYFGTWTQMGRTTILVEVMTPLALLPYFIAVKNGFDIKGFQNAIIISTFAFMIYYLMLPLLGV